MGANLGVNNTGLSFRLATTLAVSGLVLSGAACSRSHDQQLARCAKPAVTLGAGWSRQTAKFAPASLLVPDSALEHDIPADEGSLGQAWSAGSWNVYYKFDSVRTNHGFDSTASVHDVMMCVDTISGYPVKIVTLRSTSPTKPGQFGQATWKIPGGHSFFVAVLQPAGASNDSVLSLLRTIEFTKAVTDTAKK